jgi:hypothetical protein
MDFPKNEAFLGAPTIPLRRASLVQSGVFASLICSARKRPIQGPFSRFRSPRTPRRRDWGCEHQSRGGVQGRQLRGGRSAPYHSSVRKIWADMGFQGQEAKAYAARHKCDLKS